MSPSMIVTFFPIYLQGISISRGATCFVVVSLLRTLSAGRYWTWKEGRNRREKDREGGDEATERDETGLVGGFVMPRTHADVPQSARAGAALLKRETTTERALESSTRST